MPGCNKAIALLLRIFHLVHRTEMDLLFQDQQSAASFRLCTAPFHRESLAGGGFYTIIWNRGATTCILVDGISIPVAAHQIITLTPTHHFTIPSAAAGLTALQFNEAFYCIYQHDEEVSCIGFLFYGTSHIMRVSLDTAEQGRFELILHMLQEEFQNVDLIQGEMLTTLLKRFIIKCVRLGRAQHLGASVAQDKYDLIRKFNVLVEVHFREWHRVSSYAEALNKSPKTLSNLFARHTQPSPLMLIQNRLLTEAQRQLGSSQKSVKEIAHELGFADLQTFSRFFKAKTGKAPSGYRVV